MHSLFFKNILGMQKNTAQRANALRGIFLFVLCSKKGGCPPRILAGFEPAICSGLRPSPAPVRPSEYTANVQTIFKPTNKN